MEFEIKTLSHVYGCWLIVTHGLYLTLQIYVENIFCMKTTGVLYNHNKLLKLGKEDRNLLWIQHLKLRVDRLRTLLRDIT